MKKSVLLLISIAFLMVSCDFFAEKKEGIPVARVDDAYLYRTDIEALVTPQMNLEDSALVINGFITRWATQQLLMGNARRNIAQSEQDRLDNLVEQYKRDLYSQSYKDALVGKMLDSVVSDEEAREFYKTNPSNFRLNEELLKLRYIQMGETDYNSDDIKKRFIRFNNQDKKYLDSISVQFKAQSLNDSVWINKSTVVATIKPITFENEDRYLKKTDFLQLRDSLGVYMIAIEDKLNRNEEAPIEVVMPTVKQIILNKRKITLIKQLEKDITKDAIKNKQFEIFN